jgi:hypothetical protein
MPGSLLKLYFYTTMRQQNKDFNKYRLYGYPFFWVLLYLIFFLINPFDQSFKEWQEYKWYQFVIDIIASFIFSIVTFESGIQLSLFLNQRIPWEIAPRKRLMTQLVTQILIITLVFSSIYFIPLYEGERTDWLIFRQALVLGIIFSLLVTAFFTAEYFFKRFSASAIEAIKQKELTTQFQLEALKTQIDPHFLFNNFSSLAALIEKDSDLALKYLQRLSVVYRYLLANRQQHLIRLAEELSFISAYFFLYQIRYGTAVSLEVHVQPLCEEMGIPPLTLQLLVENAVKHNVVSKNHPLHIRIATEEGRLLVVSNNVNKKPTSAPGTGIGLKNIEDRYRLLSELLPQVIASDSFFTVKIPLLSYAH